MLNHEEQDKILELAKQIAETYNPGQRRNNFVWIVKWHNFLNSGPASINLFVFTTHEGASKWLDENRDKINGTDFAIEKQKIHGT